MAEQSPSPPGRGIRLQVTFEVGDETLVRAYRLLWLISRTAFALIVLVKLVSPLIGLAIG